MIKATDLWVSLGGKNILSDINLELKKGTLTAIVGRNGSGKSTLLKCLMGRLPVDKGSVWLNEKPVETWKSIERASQIAWLPQRQAIADPIQVWLLVAAARFRFEETHAKRKNKALEALSTVKMREYANRLWHSLSGGEAQRVALATLLAQECPMWLLDEPANHLDPAVQQDVYEQLIAAWRSGIGLAVVTHDLNLLQRAIPQAEMESVTVLGLDQGRISFHLPLSDPNISTALSKLYGLNVELIEHNGKALFIFGGLI